MQPLDIGEGIPPYMFSDGSEIDTDDNGWTTKRKKIVEPNNDETDSDDMEASQRFPGVPAIEVTY